MKFARIAIALAVPLALGGCFLSPGKFMSSLDLRKGGDFTFAYKGEVVFQSPGDMMDEGSKPKFWSDNMANCFKSGRTYLDEWVAETADSAKVAPEPEVLDDEDQDPDQARRPCTKAETAKLKKEFDDAQLAKAERKKKEAGEFATIFGFNPSDDAANQKLAATMMKYDGWKAVTYRGKGVFDVDYQLSGKVGHDFIFPLFPQGDFIIPFVAIRGRDKGSVAVNAPALIGGGLKGLAAKAKALGGGGKGDMPKSTVVTKGTFTVTTDGEILTNNTEDGPVAVANGRKLVWEIGPDSERIPEALIRLR